MAGKVESFLKSGDKEKISGDHEAQMNYDYGYHYYTSFEKYCKVGDTACKE